MEKSLTGGETLKALAEFVISCLELFEAEGRSLRLSLARLWLILGLLSAVGALVLGGVLLVLWALYLHLVSFLARPAAAFYCGVAALVMAGGMAWLARRLNR